MLIKVIHSKSGNTLSGLIISWACFAGIAQAEDQPVTVSVSGTVMSSTSVCSLSLDTATLRLQTKRVDELPAQGKTIDQSKADVIAVHASGDSCSRMAMKFIGNMDDVENNSLVNALQGPNAATGVGIAIYNAQGAPVNLTQTRSMEWTKSTSTLPFYAGLVGLINETPTSGNVQSTLTIELEHM